MKTEKGSNKLKMKTEKGSNNFKICKDDDIIILKAR